MHCGKDSSNQNVVLLILLLVWWRFLRIKFNSILRTIFYEIFHQNISLGTNLQENKHSLTKSVCVLKTALNCLLFNIQVSLLVWLSQVFKTQYRRRNNVIRHGIVIKLWQTNTVWRSSTPYMSYLVICERERERRDSMNMRSMLLYPSISSMFTIIPLNMIMNAVAIIFL